MEGLEGGSPGARLELCIRVAGAIKELHDNKYAHGALSPKNVMLDGEGHVLLTGFGLESLRKYLSLTVDYTNITLYTAP